MKVLFISPGYPADMPEFTRGLAQSGAQVIGVGDQPAATLPDMARVNLAAYVQVPTLWNTADVVATLRESLRGQSIDRIECLWEPCIMLAAELREHFGVPGMGIAQANRFRDKESMKLALDAAGIRTPRHTTATSAAACWEAADALGFPLILKPIAGAGSADTYRVNSIEDLQAVLPLLRHVPKVSVEEFVDGDEYTFDAITVGGEIAYFNVAWYRPRPLVARSNEWISPQVIALRDTTAPELAEGINMGRAVLEALDFNTGFAHMEWYRKTDGEVVFGEIGARPPGAHQVDQMKFACDFDVFRAWGQAVCRGAILERFERLYNVALVFKRARGTGRITGHEGLAEFVRRSGSALVWNTLLPPGTPRRDWRKTLVSDGFLMLRHAELSVTLDLADAAGRDVQVWAE